MADYARYEPTINEILADPTVKALMKADRVNPDRLQMKLLRLRRIMALGPSDDGQGLDFDNDHSGARSADIGPCVARA